MIGETTDAPSRLRYLRHRSSARCPRLMIAKRAGTGTWGSTADCSRCPLAVLGDLWRSQAPKVWPLAERAAVVITGAPAAVPVVVSVYWLAAQGPRMVP